MIFPASGKCKPTLIASWNGPVDIKLTYTVWYSTSSGTTTEPPSGASTVSGITGTSTTLIGLQGDTVYYIWVATVTSYGQGPYTRRVTRRTESSTELHL